MAGTTSRLLCVYSVTYTRHLRIESSPSGVGMIALPADQSKLTLSSSSDWAMGSIDMKSYSGNVVFLNGILVAWWTHQQFIVAASSAETGHVAVSDFSIDMYQIPFITAEESL